MKASFKVEGLDQLVRKLNKLPDAVGHKIELEVLLDAGELVVERARELVPVDTGNLRQSIAVSEMVRSGASAGLSLREGGHVTVYIGPARGGAHDGFYGHMVEFGTHTAAAHPFMRPAWDQTRGAVRDRVATRLASAINRVAKG